MVYTLRKGDDLVGFYNLKSAVKAASKTVRVTSDCIESATRTVAIRHPNSGITPGEYKLSVQAANILRLAPATVPPRSVDLMFDMGIPGWVETRRSFQGAFMIMDYISHVSGVDASATSIEQIWLRNKTREITIFHHPDVPRAIIHAQGSQLVVHTPEATVNKLITGIPESLMHAMQRTAGNGDGNVCALVREAMAAHLNPIIKPAQMEAIETAARLTGRTPVEVINGAIERYLS